MEWIVIKISRSWIKHFKLNSKILIVIVRNASKFYALLFYFLFFLLFLLLPSLSYDLRCATI